jgi:hypothetical protein
MVTVVGTTTVAVTVCVVVLLAVTGRVEFYPE